MGYKLKILDINLETHNIESRELDEQTTRSYIGGAGIASYILWNETTQSTQPFDKENPLLFMTGPLTGSHIPSTSRHIVAGISPLTGIYGEARSGGNWAYELRHAGYHGITFRGKSATPVYLWLNNNNAEIRDAENVWGKDSYKTDQILRQETNESASVASIGPAGERLVKFAGIINDGKMGRIAARCGLGALMGSKNLKAVVVRGTLPLKYFDEEGLKNEVSKIRRNYPRSKEEEIDFQINMFKREMDVGNTVVKNWQEGMFEGAYDLAERLRRMTGMQCRGCPFPCMESHWTKDGERNMLWEHWAPMGCNCLIDNAEALQEAYSLCQRYGMDTISCGGVMGFAMECFDRGLITRADTDGIDLIWGNHKAMLTMVRKIGEREGFGQILGEGVKKAAEHIGGEAPDFAMNVKGLEFPAMDPRAAMTLAVEYATENIGAGHVRAEAAQNVENLLESPESYLVFPDLGYPDQLNRFTSEGKGILTAKMQNLGCVIDSLSICTFLVNYNGVTPTQLTSMLNLITGYDYTLEELMDCGERIFTLMRMINVRRGIRKKDDILPNRILTQTRGSGGAAESLPPLDEMLKEYYQFRDWDEEGIPAREKLAQLDLTFCLGSN
jgi:aldehyde:ferredoxin oxidoreductase